MLSPSYAASCPPRPPGIPLESETLGREERVKGAGRPRGSESVHPTSIAGPWPRFWAGLAGGLLAGVVVLTQAFARGGVLYHCQGCECVCECVCMCV